MTTLTSSDPPVPALRIGYGYDVHRLVPGRRLVLGGVEIPSALGLEGHSDADVLLHAVADALLGAASLGDIGRLFPNTDERYRGIASILLLREVAALLRKHGWATVNVDATVVLERPKIAPHAAVMCQNIGDALGIPAARVSVKATTGEGMGFTGRGEGASATAVALVHAVPPVTTSEG